MADRRLDDVHIHVPRQGVGELTGLGREVQPVRVHGRNEELGGGPGQGLPQASPGRGMTSWLMSASVMAM